MNFPQYKFAKETEPELLKFLKVVEEQKFSNENNDFDKFKLWSKLLPLDSNLRNKLDESDKIPVIDLSSDDESVIPPITDLKEDPIEIHLCENSKKSNIIDIASAIKENIETQHNLSETLKDNLSNCNNSELEELFNLLNDTMSDEVIFNLGDYLQNSSNNQIILFCRCLLIPKIIKQYSDSLSTLVQQYSNNHSTVLKEEFLSKFHKINEEERKIFQQYMSNLNLTYKSALLKDFIFSIENLNETSLMIIENLLNDQVEYEALNKLVEMLSNIAEDHSKDNNFGKLLMNIIQFLGSNVILLEKPLKHIIAGHKSIWRSRLEKTFSTCYEDSSMFTQSFRD